MRFGPLSYGDISNVTISKCVVHDCRSSVFLRQSSDINIAGLRTGNPARHAAARLTLLDCQDALITGCQDHRGGDSFLAVEGARAAASACWEIASPASSMKFNARPTRLSLPCNRIVRRGWQFQ